MVAGIVILFWAFIILSLGCIVADYLMPLIFAWDDKRKEDKKK